MTGVALVPKNTEKLNLSTKALAVRRGVVGDTHGYVPHFTMDDIRQMVDTVKSRDGLLIRFLFESCCRVSEAINTRPKDLVNDADGWHVRVKGKGGKRRRVAISAAMAAELQAHCYQKGIPRDERIFQINRSRVHQIVAKAMEDAGLTKPDGVGAVHCLRHSGALHRLRETGNPRSLQHHLGHSQAAMTLRYMKTLEQDEALKIQQGVSYDW